MSHSLDNRTILVTGGGRGLGRAYAQLVAECGAHVVVSDIDAETASSVAEELCSTGLRADAVVCDVSAPEDVERLVHRTLELSGRLDGVVNNAGIQAIDDIADVDLATARQLIDVNLLGTVNVTHHAIPVMRSLGAGSIVNVTSGAQCGMRAMSVYGATKGGIASFTYSVALDCAGTAIRVNAISPLADTQMAVMSDDYRRQRDLPAGTRRRPSPEQCAAAVVYLLSDASRALNGQVIRIDSDGISLMSHPARIDASIVHAVAPDPDDVAAAIEGHMLSHLVPVGNHAGVVAQLGAGQDGARK
jgi:NAD(P)-dependent dehydrogenase (short-subunit alcohol dehydrogenase family)